jgi:hypothetical protein
MDLEYRSAGRQESGAAVDEREADVAVIAACGERAPDAGDDRAELRRADSHRRAQAGYVRPATELQEVNPFDLDFAPVRQETAGGAGRPGRVPARRRPGGRRAGGPMR